MRRAPGPLRGVPGPRRRLARGAGRARRSGSSARTARARARCSSAWPGSCGPESGLDRGRTARSRRCSSWAPASTPSCRAARTSTSTAPSSASAPRSIDRKFDEIVEFAGLEKFIDTPVKNYSSGMYVRLGFSVAINVDPDVLLVDEVLAVGDEEFQRKCNEKFAELRAAGQDHRGRVARPRPDAHDLRRAGLARARQASARSGDVGRRDRRLHRRGADRPPERGRVEGHGARWGSGEARIDRHRDRSTREGRPTNRLHTGEPVTIRIHYHAGQAHRAAGVRARHLHPRGPPRDRAQHP